MSTCNPSFLAAIASLSLVPAAIAGPVQINFPTPGMDRWMYPFNSSPATRPEASVFASIRYEGFDDRDAQFLLGFTTGPQVPPGQGPSTYIIKSARVRVFVSQGDRFVYDPTPDPIASSYELTDPLYIPDTDPGKPIELYGVGYRNGYGAVAGPGILEYTQTTPFGGVPIVQPSEGARNAFAAIFDAQGAATDISRQVRTRVDSSPMAVGKTATVALGQTVPADTQFTFDLNLCDPDTRAYFQRSLNQGQLNLMVTSLHPTTGPGSVEYPVFYTRVNPIAQALGYEAKLEMIVVRLPRSDFDNSGSLNINDFVTYLNAYAAANPAADVDDNCALNINDFVTFLNLYAAGG